MLLRVDGGKQESQEPCVLFTPFLPLVAESCSVATFMQGAERQVCSWFLEEQERLEETPSPQGRHDGRHPLSSSACPEWMTDSQEGPPHCNKPHSGS